MTPTRVYPDSRRPFWIGTNSFKYVIWLSFLFKAVDLFSFHFSDVLATTRRFLRSTIGECSPKVGFLWSYGVPVVTYHVISQDFRRIEIFWVDGRCAKSAPFWILNKNYAHASIYFYQERGRARALRAPLFLAKTFPRMSRSLNELPRGNGLCVDRKE